MTGEVERRQPTELERQETWDQTARDIEIRYAGLLSLNELSPQDQLIAIAALAPALLHVVDEARDTIERLNEEVDRSARMRYDLEIVDDGFCDVYSRFPSDRGHPSLGRAIDRLREWRKKYGMGWE